MSKKLCEICGADSQFICERCLRCEQCCAEQDRKRPLPEQHLGRWVWSRNSVKGVQLDALVIAGHGKGDYAGKKPPE